MMFGLYQQEQGRKSGTGTPALRTVDLDLHFLHDPGDEWIRSDTVRLYVPSFKLQSHMFAHRHLVMAPSRLLRSHLWWSQLIHRLYAEEASLENHQNPSLHRLPDELILMIAHYLEPVDWIVFGQSCRRSEFVRLERPVDRESQEMLRLQRNFWILLKELGYEEAGAEVD